MIGVVGGGVDGENDAGVGSVITGFDTGGGMGCSRAYFAAASLRASLSARKVFKCLVLYFPSFSLGNDFIQELDGFFEPMTPITPIDLSILVPLSIEVDDNMEFADATLDNFVSDRPLLNDKEGLRLGDASGGSLLAGETDMARPLLLFE
jgi:hypothetical protein